MSRIVIANWKLQPATLADARRLFAKQKLAVARLRFVETVYAPPITFLYPLAQSVRAKRIHFAAQRVSATIDGAEVGEVAASHAASVGASVALVGHADCRRRGDTTDMLVSQIKHAVAAGLVPVLFVGESSRDATGAYLHEVRAQLTDILRTLSHKEIAQLMLTYEPTWAISCGGGPVPFDQKATHTMALFLLKVLVEEVGEKVARRIPILYGGSVTPENAAEVAATPVLRGAVVGSASLNADSFLAIAKAFNRKL